MAAPYNTPFSVGFGNGAISGGKLLKKLSFFAKIGSQRALESVFL